MEGSIRFFAARPVAVVMILAAVLLAGVCGALELPRRQYPAVESARVLVEARYPGMGAEEIRSILALPLEDALSSVKGVVSISTVCRDGQVSAALDFRWGDDPERAAVRCREAVDSVYPALPEGAEKPTVFVSDPASAPLAVISVRSRSGDLSFARRLAEYDLRSRFRRVEGIGRVAVAGGVVRELSVSVDLRRAAARGVTASDAARLLSAECADIPAGTVREGDRELVVVAASRPSSVEELSSVMLPGPNGPIALSDIASVGERPAPRKSVFVVDGAEAVSLELYARTGADPVAAAAAIRRTVSECASDFGRDAEIVLLSDASEPISKSVVELAAAAAVGAAAAAAVIALFLRDLRCSVLAALTIPFSAAASFAVLAASGRSLNTMSLAGLALGAGMISDNAVIVLNQFAVAFRGARRPGSAEIAAAAAETAASTAGSTATTAVVFLPVLFLPGPIGAVFSDLAVSLVSAVVAGWILALFALPALYGVSWRPSRSPGAGRLEAFYRRSLRKAFRSPAAVLSLAAAAGAVGTALTFSRDVSFKSADAAAEWLAEITFPAGTELGTVAREGEEMTVLLGKVPGVVRVFGRAGAEDDESDRRADSSYRRERLVLRCLLSSRADPSSVAVGLRRAMADGIPSYLSPCLSAPDDPASKALGLDGSRVLAARGADPREARRKAETIRSSLRGAGGDCIESAVIVPSGERPELRVLPDRDASAALGLSAADIAETLRIASEGVPVARMEMEGRIVDVRLLGEPVAGAARAAVEEIPVAVSTVPLTTRSFALASRADAPAALARLDRSDVAYVRISPVPGKEGAADKAILRASALSGVSRADGSAFARYGRDLLITMALVVVLLYLTMGAQFESFIAPLLFMTAIPLAMAGVGPALFISGASLDSSSIMGMVVLFGNAVNNAIILYETSSARLRRGANPAVAAYAGAGDRVRPVLITALTAAIALVPMLAASSGASQRGMAAAMIGGTAASAALTLYATPLLLSRSSRRPE